MKSAWTSFSSTSCVCPYYSYRPNNTVNKKRNNFSFALCCACTRAPLPASKTADRMIRNIRLNKVQFSKFVSRFLYSFCGCCVVLLKWQHFSIFKMKLIQILSYSLDPWPILMLRRRGRMSDRDWGYSTVDDFNFNFDLPDVSRFFSASVDHNYPIPRLKYHQWLKYIPRVLSPHSWV